MVERQPPTGFELALPETWEVVETPPRESVRLTLGEAPVALAGASCRLRQMEQARDGTCLRARYLDVVGGVPGEAEVTIGFYSIGAPNDPGAMLAELSGAAGPDRLELVELPAGVAVRRAGCRAAGRREAGEGGDRIVQQVYLPVPGTSDEVAFFGFSSPTVDGEAQLREVFDRVAAGLSFSWSDRFTRRREPVTSGTAGSAGAVSPVEPSADGGLRLGPVVRSIFEGWPGRFIPLAHLAVAVWTVAAVVYVGQAVAALTDADPGLALWRLSKGLFLAAFGVLGYLFDRPRGGGRLAMWAVFGLVWAFFALTCPEASVFGAEDC